MDRRDLEGSFSDNFRGCDVDWGDDDVADDEVDGGDNIGKHDAIRFLIFLLHFFIGMLDRIYRFYEFMMMLILVSPNCSTLLHFNLHFDLVSFCINCDADQDHDAPVEAILQEPLQLENVEAAARVTNRKRVSFFTREQKLRILKWHRDDNTSKGATSRISTARKFHLPHHNHISHWLAQEPQLEQQPCGTRAIVRGRKADWPQLEERLHAEFKEKRDNGLKVEGWWFTTRAKQLFRELYLDKVNADDTLPFKVSKH